MTNKDTFFYLYGLSGIGKTTFQESLVCKDITGLPDCRESLSCTDYGQDIGFEFGYYKDPKFSRDAYKLYTGMINCSSWSVEVYNTWYSPVGIRGDGNEFSNIYYIPGVYQDMRTPSMYFEEECLKKIKYHKKNIGKIEVLLLVTSEEILKNRIKRRKPNCFGIRYDNPVILLEEYIKIVKLLDNVNISYTLIDNSWGGWFKEPTFAKNRPFIKYRIIQPDEIESVVTKSGVVGPEWDESKKDFNEIEYREIK